MKLIDLRAWTQTGFLKLKNKLYDKMDATKL